MDSYERQKRRERYIVRFMMEPPVAMYDIGVGPKTEWQTLKEVFPKMEVFGVEPNPKMVERLKSNGWSGPLLENAIHPTEREVSLNIFRGDDLNASILEVPNANPGYTHSVPAISLDEADIEFGGQNGVLLWMDIEGAELLALESGPNLMESGRVRWVNLEVRDTAPWIGGCTAKEIDEYMKNMNYVKVIDYNVRENLSHWYVI